MKGHSESAGRALQRESCQTPGFGGLSFGQRLAGLFAQAIGQGFQ